MKKVSLSESGIQLLFTEARSFNKWKNIPVSEEIIRKMFDLLKMGPTSANCSPARFHFVKTQKGKQKLRAGLSKGNLEKTLSAPVTVIIAYDTQFFNQLDQLFPHENAKIWFAGNKELITETAFRNSTLQGAYLMLAARSLGLDCGPLSGFNKEVINNLFFPDGQFNVNFICNIGYGDTDDILPRLPRFNFDDVCVFS
ncbi:MAG: malonic semialdehyde reductase [Rhodospirillaceae bacterium]|nr:malonic semialdehyde reductase [Rhodospirillaceae bacterium]